MLEHAHGKHFSATRPIDDDSDFRSDAPGLNPMSGATGRSSYSRSPAGESSAATDRTTGIHGSHPRHNVLHGYRRRSNPTIPENLRHRYAAVVSRRSPE